MKRINQYKKLFSVEDAIDLKTLKKSYRNLVKEWHPDKFQDGDVGQEVAEKKSVEIIDGYHFLVSIAPETKVANLKEYTETISNSSILDFQHKGQLLEITFLDGTTYEYFGVSKAVFIKFLNSDKQMRFARRSIFNSYLYRKSKKDLQEA
ncbi:KTSC domain-containing protein [Winogradskyella litoriviva]|uniref:KTSC domain-containing protein n=1 Tax=Winogradskyella litoriviva TaxID=1220182 RepID=A0ABX2E719_9FLAO|nr:KTSC domain-containing protein [Winogradskyella litoriviva]NRD23584.1 KTSC domain-containing protein [Winogradskyella litoriviva]